MVKNEGLTGTNVQLLLIVMGIVILLLPTFFDTIKRFVNDIWWLGLLFIAMGAVLMYGKRRFGSGKR